MAKRSIIDVVYDEVKKRQSGPSKFISVMSVHDQGDRVLLFGSDINYHIIASRADNVQVGDEIEFEPYGWNFGWFKRKVQP